MKQPFFFAVSGTKNSGKTTLIRKMLPIFQRYGLRTAVVKHDGHDFCADVPGTDSYRYVEAGAYGAAVFSGTKYMVVKQQEQTSEQELAAYFPEADLILLEGFKHSDYPKIEVVREGISERGVRCRNRVIAVASDCPQSCRGETPVVDINDAEAAAEIILDQWMIERELSMIVLAGGKSTRMGRDKADLTYGGETFLQRQIDKGRMIGIHDIVISGYHGDGCREKTVPDRYAERGPLGGLEAALRETSGRYSLVLPVDMPLVSTDMIRELIREFRKMWMKGKQKPVFVTMHEDRIEPLFGIYNSGVADLIEASILAGSYSMCGLLNKAGYETCEIHASEEKFGNINSPEVYKKLLAREF